MRKRQLYFSNQNITKGKGRSKRSKLKSIGMTAALLSMFSLVTPAAVYAAPETLQIHRKYLLTVHLR